MEHHGTDRGFAFPHRDMRVAVVLVDRPFVPFGRPDGQLELDPVGPYLPDDVLEGLLGFARQRELPFEDGALGV